MTVYSKMQADYKDSSPSSAKQCQHCSMFTPGKSPGKCSIVHGAINPTGVCHYFEKKNG